MARYEDFGGGGNNPCGAYYPRSGPLNMASESACVPQNYGSQPADGANFNFWGPEAGTTRGKGLCCDVFKRIGPQSYVWEPTTYYPIFSTVAGTGEECPGCFYHARRNHTSSNDSSGVAWSDDKPCEHKLAWFVNSVNDYVEKWSGCKALIDEGMPGNCTMHHSFGLIMDTTTNISHMGSPNGSCQSNCMQLNINYFEQYVAGQYLTYAQYPPNNFDDKTAYDCETKKTDFQGNNGPTGSKLIWAGFAPNQWNPSNSSPNNSPGLGNQSKNFGPTNPVPGYTTATVINWDPTLGNSPSNQTYAVRQNLNGVMYQGYLPENSNENNAWGLLSPSLGGTPSQEDSHLWARKSVWRVSDAGEDAYPTSIDDAFACCTYVSFGCTDPSFGNYDPNAFLDCDGIPKTNRELVTVDDNGVETITCDDINGNPGVCWDSNGLQCSECIDNTGSPNAALNGLPNPNYNPNYGEYFNAPNGNCTQQILDSCGSGGQLSVNAWTDMFNMRPTSSLYGGGATYLGNPNKGDGRAKFWDKDGVDVTNPNVRPRCQCNNSGCLLPGADTYSSLNTTDCSNQPASVSFLGMLVGDVTCCSYTKYGCTDETKITPPLNNYFCSIDINGDGTPDNQMFCMDPTTGIPCNMGPCPANGGVPLGPGSGTPGFNNPTVNLIDDGSCDLILIPGCKDDGGNLAGGSWPSPVYPGYAAMNYDASATVHIQNLCEYVFGCPDPLADNALTPVCPSSTLTGSISNCATVYGVTNQFVEDNLIPNIECCDYNIPGTGPGCTDPNALNFNPLADTDDGSCIYNIEGCTDPNALNFNPAATLDDSSCLYPGDYPIEGDNFLDGSPIEICREPLTKEEVLMNVCQPTEIQSEVFIERGKQSVFEPNQRLDEVRTIGGLKIYGYGFYNIKEQI